jgi:hypothetical protein
VDIFAYIAWHEGDLTTKAVKNRIYVHPSARAGWAHYIDTVPRDPTAALPIHNIPDRSFLTDQSDPESARQWPKANGINVRGTPLGTPDFTESYLFGKGIKHRELLCCIKDVAVACFPREVVAMLAGAAGPRLTHLLKSVETKPRTETWMIEKDSAHLSTWLHCLTASSDLDMALGLVDKDLLTD